MKFVTVMRRPFAIFGPREKVRENTIFEAEIVKQVFDDEQTFPHALEFCWGWHVRSSSKRSCVTTFLISNDESFLRIQLEPPEQKTLSCLKIWSINISRSALLNASTARTKRDEKWGDSVSSIHDFDNTTCKHRPTRDISWLVISWSIQSPILARLLHIKTNGSTLSV